MNKKQRDQLKKVITKLGLLENEASVYIALLEIGPSTVSPISKKAEVKRSSIYNFINHLLQMGLVSVHIKNNRHYYCAENPDHINNMVVSYSEQIKKAIPILGSLYAAKDYHPTTRIFQGTEGIKKALYSALECKEKKLYFIIDINSAVGNLGVKFWDDYIGKMIERKIIGHSLRHTEQKDKIPNYKYLKKEQYQTTTLVARYLPKQIKVPNTMVVYDNKVIMISPCEENWALVIESESISKSIRIFHGVLWSMSR